MYLSCKKKKARGSFLLKKRNFSEKMKVLICKDACISTFIVALCIVAKI